MESRSVELEATPKDRIEAVIQKWLRDEIHGGPLSQVTECWNALYQALPSLAERIVATMEEV